MPACQFEIIIFFKLTSSISFLVVVVRGKVRLLKTKLIGYSNGLLRFRRFLYSTCVGRSGTTSDVRKLCLASRDNYMKSPVKNSTTILRMVQFEGYLRKNAPRIFSCWVYVFYLYLCSISFHTRTIKFCFCLLIVAFILNIIEFTSALRKVLHAPRTNDQRSSESLRMISSIGGLRSTHLADWNFHSFSLEMNVHCLQTNVN